MRSVAPPMPCTTTSLQATNATRKRMVQPPVPRFCIKRREFSPSFWPLYPSLCWHIHKRKRITDGHVRFFHWAPFYRWKKSYCMKGSGTRKDTQHHPTVGKGKLKPQWDTATRPLEWLSFKRQIIPRVGKDVLQLGHLCVAGRTIKQGATLGNIFAA